MKTPILGSSYVARSVNAAANRCVNLFAEAVPEGGKEAAFFSRCPGLRLITTIGTGPIRGLWQFGGFAYVASGTTLYKVNSAWSASVIGTITGTGQVSMANSATQLWIACNPDAFVYTVDTGTFQQLADSITNIFDGAGTVSYMDEFFLFNKPDTDEIYASNNADGAVIPVGSFTQVTGTSDIIISVMANHRELWIFATNSIEVYYYSGGEFFPFDRIQGAFNEIGCAAAYSVAKLDNGLFWLGSDARGSGIVYRTNGYSGQRISTHAIEFAISGYSVISDAVAFTYQQEGHAFYVLTFPTEGKTWVFDISTMAWHERASYVGGEFARHRANCQMNFNNQAVVGDYENGKIYAYDLDVYTDDSQTQKWLRSWRALPPGQNNLKRSVQHSLQLDCETGSGAQVYSEPTVSLRWSDDGGHTWSNYHEKGIGLTGNYSKRVIWRRLGMTMKLRDRVYEISGTNDQKVAIIGAELIVDQTSS